MTKTVVDLFDEAVELNENDRAALAGLLLESIEGEPGPDIEAAWAKEIEHRVEQLEKGEVELIPWEEVKSKLHRKLEETS